jgi:hypothetical protein
MCFAQAKEQQTSIYRSKAHQSNIFMLQASIAACLPRLQRDFLVQFQVVYHKPFKSFVVILIA